MGRSAFLSCLLCRLFVGATLLREGIEKIRSGFIARDGVKSYVDQMLDSESPFGFYRTFLTDVVLPHHDLVSLCVVGGEVIVGALLVAGLLTRTAALVGIMMMANFLLVAGLGLQPSIPGAFLLLLLVTLATNTGRIAGLDRLLAGRGTSKARTSAPVTANA